MYSYTYFLVPMASMFSCLFLNSIDGLNFRREIEDLAY